VVPAGVVNASVTRVVVVAINALTMKPAVRVSVMVAVHRGKTGIVPLVSAKVDLVTVEIGMLVTTGWGNVVANITIMLLLLADLNLNVLERCAVAVKQLNRIR